jgi:hypothetical protein
MPLELKCKCFLARLPSELTPQQLSAVGEWARKNCALHRLSREGDAVVLVAMREKPRSSKMHARLLRAALARLPSHVALPTTAGKPWLRLLDDGEEFEAALRPCAGVCAASGDEDGEERVVLLPRRASAASRPPSCAPVAAARRLEVAGAFALEPPAASAWPTQSSAGAGGACAFGTQRQSAR